MKKIRTAITVTIIIPTLLATVACQPITKHTEQISYQEKLQQLFESAHEYISNQPNKILDLDQISLYPGETASFYISAYLVTKDEKYKEDSERELEFAHSLQDENNVFFIPNRTAKDDPGYGHGYITRDASARHILNLYIAYKTLDDEKYLKWADEAATAMIKYLKREPFTSTTGEQFVLFASIFYSTPPYKVHTETWIDVNQNAALGTAFTLLYNEPESSLHDNETAKDIALNELEASMSLQNQETGEIPIGGIYKGYEGHLTQYDTLYGSYTTSMWIMANSRLKNENIEKHIQAAAKWLKISSEKDTSTRALCCNATGSYYITEMTPTKEDKWYTEENWHKIAALYKAGLLKDQTPTCLNATRLPEKVEKDPRWLMPIAFFKVARIPESVFLECDQTNQ